MKKIFEITGIVVGAMLVLFVISGYIVLWPGILYFRYEYPKETHPDIYMIPEAKTLQPKELSSAGDVFGYKDLKVQSLWGAPIRKKEGKKEAVLFEFREGKKVVILKNSGIFWLYKTQCSTDKQLKELIGTSPMSYNTIKPLVEITPDNINLLTTPGNIIKQIEMLIIKMITAVGCEKTYYLETSGLDALEYYDYNDKHLGAIVDITDRTDNFYQIMISDNELSQDKVEEFVSSIKINAE